MSWNKVRASIKYKSGTFTSYALADSSMTVGIKARCVVVSGYETECTIVEICKENIKYSSNHAKIIGTAQQISKEDKAMMDEIFATVLVDDGRNYVKRCRALDVIAKGTEVAYEGNDGRLHVATVIESIPAGTPYESHKGVDVAGFVACIVDRDMLDVSKLREKSYNETMVQLKARKKLFEERAIWEMLAERDPKAKELLDTLNSLKGGNI